MDFDSLRIERKQLEELMLFFDKVQELENRLDDMHQRVLRLEMQ